jgi:hypothetical protein
MISWPGFVDGEGCFFVGIGLGIGIGIHLYAANSRIPKDKPWDYKKLCKKW